MLLFSKWVKGNSFFFVFQTLLKTLMKHFLCITLTMHAKILLADSNIAPSITKRAKLFVLFCVVPPVFTVGLHTLRFFSGQKRPTTNWNFLFSPINHHGKKNCFTQQFSWDWFIYISLNFQGIKEKCFWEIKPVDILLDKNFLFMLERWKCIISGVHCNFLPHENYGDLELRGPWRKNLHYLWKRAVRITKKPYVCCG